MLLNIIVMTIPVAPILMVHMNEVVMRATSVMVLKVLTPTNVRSTELLVSLLVSLINSGVSIAVILIEHALIQMITIPVLVTMVLKVMASHVKMNMLIQFVVLLVKRTATLTPPVQTLSVHMKAAVTTVTSEMEQFVKMLMDAMNLLFITTKPPATIILVVLTVHVMMNGEMMV